MQLLLKIVASHSIACSLSEAGICVVKSYLLKIPAAAPLSSCQVESEVVTRRRRRGRAGPVSVTNTGCSRSPGTAIGRVESAAGRCGGAPVADRRGRAQLGLQRTAEVFTENF